MMLQILRNPFVILWAIRCRASACSFMKGRWDLLTPQTTEETLRFPLHKMAQANLRCCHPNTYSLLNDLTENANLFFMEANAVAGKQAQADAIALGDVTKTFNFEE